MAFNPAAPLVITQKQYRSLFSQVVEHTTVETPLGVVPQIVNAASWLSVSISSIVNPKKFRILFGIKSAVNSLAPGNYQTTVLFKHQYESGGTVFNVEEQYVVKLTVVQTIKLNASRSQFNFVYYEGGNPPPNDYFEIRTENSWTALPDQSWLTLNKLSGTGTSALTMSVNVAGLSVGEYTGQILFDDGYDKVLVNVNLSVRGEDTADDFLLVSPSSIALSEVAGQAPGSSRAIQVQSSENFTISKNVSWIQLSSTSETAGTKSITATIIDTEALAPGNYSGKITVSSSFSVKLVSVSLLINDSEIEGIDLDEFYFADDRDKITLLNSQPDSELVLEYDVQIGSEEHLLTKRVPFYKGKGIALIADMANNLVAHKELFTSSSSRVFSPVSLLDMTIRAYDKDLYSTQQNLRETYTGIQAITGGTPKTANRLSKVPEVIYAPKTGIVGFTFKADTKPDDITISGAVSQVKSVGSVPGNIFTCYVNLAEFALNAGDVVNITCGGFLLQVKIRPIEPQLTHVAWLNEWTCPEFHTFSGFLEIDRVSDKITGTFAKEGREITRVLEVKRPKEYQLNTGFIYSNDEYEWLSSILDAKKIWIYTGGAWTEVLCTTSSMNLYRTREYFKSYRLTFKNAII